MKRTNWTLVCGLTLILATGIVACGDSDNSSGPTPTSTATRPPTPTPTIPPVAPNELCAQSPHDQLCSFLPHTVIDADLQLAGYSQLAATQQRPFDIFSWESFVALNWPANADGTPLSDPIGTHPDAPRVWQSYPTVFDVFSVETATGLKGSPDECAGISDQALPILQMSAKSSLIPAMSGSILQATEQPLIDRNLNFVVYDIRMHPVEVNYVTSNGLNTLGGQETFKQMGNTVSFPQGFYANLSTRSGGSVGAMEVKFAWRILDASKGDQLDRFYTMPALVFVPAATSSSGQAFCFKATLGLVGMHIIQRTTIPGVQGSASDFGADWIWSTFEHDDNAPFAATPGDPTSTSPVPTPCVPPANAGNYSFFNPACTGPACTPNGAPTPTTGKGFIWNTSPPYASQYANDGQYGTQVVRCWNIFSETEEVNANFRSKLAGTVWANYRLINSQWQGGIENPLTENGNIPRFLANTTLETYIQDNASCLDCHKYATTAVGQDANFSFLLQLPLLMSAH